MYFFNNFFIYSIFGFIMESTIYKFNDVCRHSGILFGPYTLVYGFGIIAILIINNLFKKVNINKILKLFFLFLILVFSLTIIEWLGGNIINIIFDIDLWDYSNHLIHFGKYISLFTSISWGILGLIFVYFLKPKTDRLIKLISKKRSKIFMLIIFVDSIMTLLLKV